MKIFLIMALITLALLLQLAWNIHRDGETTMLNAEVVRLTKSIQVNQYVNQKYICRKAVSEI